MSEYAVYLDDSGHPDDKPYVVVAGFLASETQWLACEPEWRAALQKHNLGTVFHMADFEARKLRNRAPILDELTDIINSHTQAHFSAAVSMRVYRRVNSSRPLEEAIGTPYSICARVIAHNLEPWKRKHLHPNDTLLVFVEDGTKHKGDMEEAFRRDGLPIPQAVPKAHPRAQPGDLLAWEFFHFRNTGIRRRSLIKLLDGRDFAHGNMDDERKLIDACDLYNLPLRKDIPAGATFAFHSTPKRKRRRTIH
jgi:hypothetical protein